MLWCRYPSGWNVDSGSRGPGSNSWMGCRHNILGKILTGIITQFFFKFFSHDSIISLSIQMCFWRIIFHFNPLNWNYLNPPFPIQGVKRKKNPLKGSKIFWPSSFPGDFFLGHLSVYWFRKTKNIAVMTFVPQRPLFVVLRPD